MTPVTPDSPAATTSVMTELPSKWPKVVGVLSIVFGSIGVLYWGCCNIGGGAAATVVPQLLANNPDAQNVPMVDSTGVYDAAYFAVGGANAVWALVLLISGIMLVKRSRNARFFSMFWAVLKILLLVVSAYVAYGVAGRNAEAMRVYIAENPDLPGTGMMKIGAEVNPWIGVLIGVAYTLPYPLFLLIWFMRGKIRRETAEW